MMAEGENRYMVHPRPRSGTTLLVVAAMLYATIAAPGTANAANVILGSGQSLTSGQRINTNTGCYLIMQSDGNLVEYCSGSAYWNSHTQSNPNSRLVVQTDGNVVIYSAGGAVLWQTGTVGYAGAYLQLQDDKNLVVYRSGTALWAVSWIQSATGAQTYAQRLFPRYGWSLSSQWTCLLNLWNRESGWRWNADNPSSSAYGIPQALPGSKMATFGADWLTNGLTQVQWGADYIKSRYGTPCSAWSHSQTYGWY